MLLRANERVLTGTSTGTFASFGLELLEKCDQMFEKELVYLKDVGANSILQDIARARENIQKSLAGVSIVSPTVASCLMFYNFLLTAEMFYIYSHIFDLKRGLYTIWSLLPSLTCLVIGVQLNSAENSVV